MSELESFSPEPQKLTALPPINFDAFPQPRQTDSTRPREDTNPSSIRIRVNLPDGNPQTSTVREFDASDPRAQTVLRNRASMVRITSSIGNASGFIITANGEIATAAHVVGNDNQVRIRLSDGRTYNATVIRRQETSDIAILRIARNNPNETFQPVRLAQNTRDVSPHARIAALGYPNGAFDLHLTAGNLQNNRIFMEGPSFRRSLYFQSNVRAGNSGGPLFNLETGEVIGLTKSILSQTNHNYASTIEDLHRLRSNGPTLNSSDFVIPASLTFPARESIYLGVSSAHYALRANPGHYWNFTQRGLLPVHAAVNTWSDFSNLSNSFSSGSTADKVAATINLGSNTMMMSGLLALRYPQLAAPLAAVQLGGAALRFTNYLLRDRAY